VSILAAFGKRLDTLTENGHVEQNRLVTGIVVPEFVVCLLEVPLQRSGAEAQGNDRIGEEIRAHSLFAVAEGIRDRRVQDTELRIDCHRLPDAAAVSLAADPRRARDIPTLIFFVLRNRVEVPENLSGLRIDGEHVSAGNVAFAAG